MYRRYIIISAALLAMVSCSTTRVLEEDQSRLARNEIEVVGDRKFPTSELSTYISQQPGRNGIGGWNPFLYVYNWSGKGNGALARFCRKIGVAPVVFDQSLVNDSNENIKKHLEYLGYYDSKVEGKADVNNRKAVVKYTVTLGNRYRIDDIRYSLPSEGTFAEEFLADTLNSLVKVGDYLSESVLEKESERSAAIFRGLGYYGFNQNRYFFVADTLSGTGSAVLDYQIRNYSRSETEANAEPVTKYTISSVSISHSKDLPFSEKVLRGMNTIRPGDLYDEAVVNRTYERFSALKVFNSVNIEMTPVDSSSVDCHINLSESNVQGVKFNLEASSNSSGLMGVSPQISYYHKNIFHGGEWLNLGFSGNFQFKFNDNTRSNEFGISSSLSLPKFLGLPYSRFRGSSVPRTEFNFAFNYQDRPEYARNILSVSYDYSGNNGRGFYYQVYPFQLSYVRLFGLDSDFSKVLDKNPYMKYSYQSHCDAGVGGMVYYSTNTDVVPKTSYWYSRLNLDLSGNLISAFKSALKKDENGDGLILGAPFSQYVRVEFNFGKTVRFGRDDRHAVATRFVAGAGCAYGNSSSMPYEKQFYCGGSSSMRGWQARALGPGRAQMGDFFSIPSQTGDMKFELDAEYRFPVIWKLEGALFAEAGNVWDIISDDEASKFTFRGLGDSIAADWGIGIRVNLDLLLLRLDWGMKVREPSREESWLTPSDWFSSNGYAVHFGVGYPF